MKEAIYYEREIRLAESRLKYMQERLELRNDQDVFNPEKKQREPSWVILERHPWLTRAALSGLRQTHDIDPPGGYKRWLCGK